MDLHDFWEENKKWILGVVAGLVVFLIAKAVVTGMYDTKAKNPYSGQFNDPIYQNAELEKARADQRRLDDTLEGLFAAARFQLPDGFDLTGKGDAEIYWQRTYTQLRRALRDEAYELNVEFPEPSFTWQVPTAERAEVERALVGACVVKHIATQLFAAHRSVTEKNFEALGLREFGQFALDRARKSTRRSSRDKGLQVQDLLEEVGVQFKFLCDHATLHQFLENCRATSPRIGLKALKIVHGRRPGDPLVVQGTAVALTIKDIPAENT